MNHEFEDAPGCVQEQLHRILASADFKSTNQLSRFLRFVVEETLAGRSDKIKAYTIAIDVLGKNSSFDPQTDATVRILAGRLRARLDQYYSRVGKHDPLRITIPKGCYIPVFQPLENDNGRGNGLLTQGTDPVAAEDKPSIAVLPFVNLSGEPNEDYFAQGLTEQLILALGDYEGLTVLPRYATMHYQGHGQDISHTGQSLGIRFVMEGSVRNVGQTIRVNVYLSDALMNRQIWTRAYQRTLTLHNLLAVQDEIAQNVTIRIGDLYGGVIPRIVGKEKQANARFESLTAYTASMRFMHFFSELSPEHFSAALQGMERALEVEPDNPELLAMLSTLCRAGYGLGFSAAANPLPRAMQLARKAVSLDPHSQQARIALAGAYQLARNIRGMVRESEIVLSLKPFGTLYATAAWNIALAGQWQRGLAILQEQMEAMQYYPGWFHIPVFLNHYRRFEYEAALMEAHKMTTPTLFIDPLQRAAALGQLGQPDRSRRAIAELLELHSKFPEDPRRYLNWLIPFDDLVDHLLEGLEKAGLALS